MIADRPAEVADRAVPGHWEGDLITGTENKTAIGTLVERQTRFVMLLHLPDDHGAVAVRDAITDAIATLPAELRRSLTWDQGIELSEHAQLTIDADLPVYFCDPHSPWQRGSNENTNGLLRQYFPKGTNLSVHARCPRYRDRKSPQGGRGTLGTDGGVLRLGNGRPTVPFLRDMAALASRASDQHHHLYCWVCV